MISSKLDASVSLSCITALPANPTVRLVPVRYKRCGCWQMRFRFTTRRSRTYLIGQPYESRIAESRGVWRGSRRLIPSTKCSDDCWHLRWTEAVLHCALNDFLFVFWKSREQCYGMCSLIRLKPPRIWVWMVSSCHGKLRLTKPKKNFDRSLGARDIIHLGLATSKEYTRFEMLEKFKQAKWLSTSFQHSVNNRSVFESTNEEPFTELDARVEF